MVVGHLHPVAQNRVGDGKCRVPYGCCTALIQIGTHRIGNRIVVFTRKHGGFFNDARRGFQRKACIRPADIGDQSGISGLFIRRRRHGSSLLDGSKRG